jgi:hypothetical protein
MVILIYLFVGLMFSFVLAIVYAAITIGLGKISEDFEVSGPDGWTFFDFCKRYWIVAAVYTFVSLPLGGLLGIVALFFAYKFVFDAGLQHTLVVGIVGGIIAQVLFVLMVIGALVPLLALAGS